MRAVTLARVREILQLHDEIGQALRTTLPKAIRIGQLLAEQKAEVRHGQWLPWIKANLPFSARTVQDYLRFYARRDELKSVPGADIREARNLLTGAGFAGQATPRRVTTNVPARRPVVVLPVKQIRHGLAAGLRRLARWIDA